MALRRSRSTLIFINVILFFALCAKPISSQGKEDPPPPSLPKIDLQKSLRDQNGDNIKVTIETLGNLKLAIDDYKPYFQERKACWKSSQKAKHCYDQCEGDYCVASDFTTGGIESLNKQDLPKAKCDIGNVATNIQKCQDCFEQTGDGQDQVITDINMWVKGLAESCLDMLKEAENGVQKLSVDQNDKEDLPAPSLPKLDLHKYKSLLDQNPDSTTVAMEYIESLKPTLKIYNEWYPQRKACWKTPESAKPCCDQCQENFGVAFDLVPGVIESLTNQDLPKVKCEINNIITIIQKCQDCFEQTGNGGDQVVKDMNMNIKGQVQHFFDLLPAENGVQKLSVGQNDDATKRAIEGLEGIKHDL